MSRIVTVALMLVVLLFGIFLGTRISGRRVESSGAGQQKIVEAYNLMRQFYVDEVGGDSLAGAGIEGMAGLLDPHTVYLEPEKVTYEQAEFEGNFDGIGIEFDIVNDTLLVVTPLSGGPSAAVGLASGDRIIGIDGVSAIGITQRDVLKKLRGKQGSMVQLDVFRPLDGKRMDFSVTRGKISTSSIEAAFMVNQQVGYIRLSRFIATTADEFRSSLQLLKQQGMKRLLLDMRGNPGGFLEQAVAVADEFLSEGKLIVYTKSRKGSLPDERYEARSGDTFERGDVVVLIDRGSASAAEIVAGALQDNKRAVVVGEPSFGKGLVQQQLPFADGSALRLTVARYYTPSGRQIQRVYRKGVAGREHYFEESMSNISPNKLFDDPDTLLYYENNNVSVYNTSTLPSLLLSLKGKKGENNRLTDLRDAGGIIPNYWVNARSYSSFYQELYRTGLYDEVARKLLDDPHSLVQKYRDSLERFMTSYTEEPNFEALLAKACQSKGVRFNRVALLQDRHAIVLALKGRMAHQLFGSSGQIKFYVKTADPLVRVATSVPLSTR
uniref:C-terminal processing peptidase-3, Serine peptidase, MEROPS family S41A n=1 Tax=Chlorobium chlorochromatii (strain CaD3) TaxID=340177 RepID=Q3ASE6_CHLCH